MYSLKKPLNVETLNRTLPITWVSQITICFYSPSAKSYQDSSYLFMIPRGGLRSK